MKEEIKVGQRWVRRDGKVVSITHHDEEDSVWPWAAGGTWYTRQGRYLNGRMTHPFDLVELASDEPADDDLQPPAGICAGSGPSILGAGKVYLSTIHPAGSELVAALNDDEHPYHLLAEVLVAAFNQAASGKGKERHANDGVRFEDQPMSTINKALGSIDGFVYQAHKKSLEAKRLPNGRSQAELFGAINYLAGAVIALDTWAAE